MKIKHFCTVCNDYENKSILVIQSIPRDFVIRTTCAKGHNQIIILTNPLYSLLFDESIKALMQQNYRACIFEAASALERFFEHAIRIFIIPRQDIDNLEKIEQFNSTWKIIRNMSERQLGAFIMLFHNTTKQSPILLNEKLSSLRNNTIHKGYIPFQDEAWQFVKSVYDIIQTNRVIIRPHDENIFWLLDQRVDFENFSTSDSDTKKTIAYNGPHFFNSSFGFNFDDAIKRYYDEHLKV